MRAPDTQPHVLPKPVMSVVNTAVPVVHSDKRADDLESYFLRGTLHLIHLARALELASRLSLYKSMEGALKLETAMRLSSLAEKINQLLEGADVDIYLDRRGLRKKEPKKVRLTFYTNCRLCLNPLFHVDTQFRSH